MGVNCIVYATAEVLFDDLIGVILFQFVLTANPTPNQIRQGVVVRGVVQHSTLDVNGDCSLVELQTTARERRQILFLSTSPNDRRFVSVKWAIPRLALVQLGAPIIGDVYQQRIAKILGQSVAVEPSKASVKNQVCSDSSE